MVNGKARRAKWLTDIAAGGAKIEDDRVEKARDHDYEPDPKYAATMRDLDCLVCGQPKRYHR